MNFIKTATAILSAISATLVMSALGADKANALSEVSLPSTIMIKSAHSNMVVDKFGDNPSVADKAHLYSQENPATFTLRPIRSANGSYETQLASRSNLCFTAAGGLNPNMGNGTQAVFSGDCANSLNLRFYDDGTVRIGRNTGMCLTNQGNRYNTLFNKLHFWACDGSPETKWNFVGVGNPGSYNPPAPVVQQYSPPAQSSVVVIPLGNTPYFGPINSDRITTAGSNEPLLKKIAGIATNFYVNGKICSWAQGNYLAMATCFVANPNGFMKTNGNLTPVYHIYPNTLAASWDQANTHCKTYYTAPGRTVYLTWNEGVKKCVGFD
jgi:hypothetical protein